jgi:hypothetical protein
LCQDCNKAIGLINDSSYTATRLANYLRRSMG